jgi:lycopene beta-cyclase
MTSHGQPSVGIRGAGVAGLSLAVALKEILPTIHVHLFDVRPKLPHPERTFCFFRYPNSRCPVEPTHSWQQVMFAGSVFRRTISCHDAPYSMIEGEQFFATLLEHVENLDVRCHWECSDISISPSVIHVDGAEYHFDVVVDAAHSIERCRATLWQSFAGIWVETTAPAFDSGVATLMDLNVPDCAAPVRFMYVLPTSSTTALVEHTIFHHSPMPREWHLEMCDRWIEERQLPSMTTHRTEYGVIPMGVTRPTAIPGVLRIGTAGGSIRASTGYGFQSILHETEALARAISLSLKNPKSVLKPPHSSTPHWMQLGDDLFVRALAREGAAGQALMEHLLRTAPNQELVRFLAGNASLGEALKVMRCVPKYPMLKTLLSRDSAALENVP